MTVFDLEADIPELIDHLGTPKNLAKISFGADPSVGIQVFVLPHCEFRYLNKVIFNVFKELKPQQIRLISYGPPLGYGDPYELDEMILDRGMFDLNGLHAEPGNLINVDVKNAGNYARMHAHRIDVQQAQVGPTTMDHLHKLLENMTSRNGGTFGDDSDVVFSFGPKLQIRYAIRAMNAAKDAGLGRLYWTALNSKSTD